VAFMASTCEQRAEPESSPVSPLALDPAVYAPWTGDLTARGEPDHSTGGYPMKGARGPPGSRSGEVLERVRLTTAAGG